MTSISEPWPRTLTEPMLLFSGLTQEVMITGSDYTLPQPYQSAFPCQVLLPWNHTTSKVIKALGLFSVSHISSVATSSCYGYLSGKWAPWQLWKPVQSNLSLLNVSFAIWPIMFKLPLVALVTFLCLLFNGKICVDLIYISFPSIIPTMKVSNQTFSHLTTHRNWQKQATHYAFLACPKTPLKWSAERMWYIGMYTPEGTLFLWICFSSSAQHLP